MREKKKSYRESVHIQPVIAVLVRIQDIRRYVAWCAAASTQSLVARKETGHTKVGQLDTNALLPLQQALNGLSFALVEGEADVGQLDVTVRNT